MIGDRVSDPTKFRQQVGSLIYWTMTRPDIAYAVRLVSQFMHDPREPHSLPMQAHPTCLV